MRTKHAEIIKAWLDGAEIEMKIDGKWIPKSTEVVAFFEEIEYRIKPKQKYTIGQLFKITHKYINEFTEYEHNWEEDYILCQVEAYQLALIGLNTGNRISSPLIFNDTFITEDELWDLIVGPNGDRTRYEVVYIGSYRGTK